MIESLIFLSILFIELSMLINMSYWGDSYIRIRDYIPTEQKDMENFYILKKLGMPQEEIIDFTLQREKKINFTC